MTCVTYVINTNECSEGLMQNATKKLQFFTLTVLKMAHDSGSAGKKCEKCLELHCDKCVLYIGTQLAKYGRHHVCSVPFTRHRLSAIGLFTIFGLSMEWTIVSLMLKAKAIRSIFIT